MVHVIGVVLAWALWMFAATEPRALQESPGGLDALRFLEGEWSARFELFEETWGPEGAGSATGSVSGSFGGGGSWFEMLATADLPGSGPYSVRILIHAGGGSGEITAFVVNSFGSGATYTGRIVDDSSLVFHGRLGTKIQRVRYERRGERIRYLADESTDGGATYRRHTESWWTGASTSPPPFSEVSPLADQPRSPAALAPPRISHVEISAGDAERVAAFYAETFGWAFDLGPDETGALAYRLGRAGEDESAITVGIYEEGDGGEQPIVTVYVPDIDRALERIVDRGGEVTVAKFAIPGAGWLAYFTDPEGNRLAVYEADPTTRR